MVQRWRVEKRVGHSPGGDHTGRRASFRLETVAPQRSRVCDQSAKDHQKMDQELAVSISIIKRSRTSDMLSLPMNRNGPGHPQGLIANLIPFNVFFFLSVRYYSTKNK